MSTVLLSFLLAIGVLVGCLQMRALMRALRRRRFKGLELRPNCLLTRHPIAFLTSPRSLFRLLEQWNDVPLFLREHGYEVMVIELPANSRNAKPVISALDELGDRCHLIADSSQERTLEELAEYKHPNVASLTVVRHPVANSQGPRTISIEDLKPLAVAIETFEVALTPLRDRLERFTFEEPFLDLAISLAERDAMISD